MSEVKIMDTTYFKKQIMDAMKFILIFVRTLFHKTDNYITIM